MSKKDLIQAMEEFEKAAKKLSVVWGQQDDKTFDLLSEKYPFEADFDEIIYEIGEWIDHVKQELEKGWERHHTGGGIWCLEKDFTTTDGQTVTVQAFKDGAQIKDSDDFIFDLTETEPIKGKDYERFTPEQIKEIVDACYLA